MTLLVSFDIPPVAFKLKPFYRKGHASLFGVFDCVCKDICDDLLDPYLIPVKDGRYGRIYFKLKLKPLVLNPLFHNVHKIVYNGGELVLHRKDIHLPGFYLRKIKDVIYYA